MVSAWTRRVRADVMASLPGGTRAWLDPERETRGTVANALPAASPALSGPADGDGVIGWQVAVRPLSSARWYLSHTDLMTGDEAEREAKSWRKRGHQAKPVQVREVPR